MKHSLQVPFTESLPVPLFLRTTLMPDDAIFPSHIHSWGEFVYSHNGVVQVMVEQERYLVPPQYGLWLPPKMQHVGLNRREVLQSSLYVAGELCGTLPAKPQALMVSPFMRSVLDHARESTLDYKSQRHLRLLTAFFWTNWRRRREPGRFFRLLRMQFWGKFSITWKAIWKTTALSLNWPAKRK